MKAILCQTLLLLIPCFLFAQKKQVVKDSVKKDSVHVSFVDRMQLFAKESAISSAKEFDADKAVLDQNKIFEEIKKNLQKAKIYLKLSADTATTIAMLTSINKDFITATDSVLSSNHGIQTFRNLTATAKILTELDIKAAKLKVILDLREKQLNTFRYTLDSLMSLPALFKFSRDSTTLIKYIGQIKVIAFESSPVDSLLKQSTLITQELLNRTNLILFKLQAHQEEIAVVQKHLIKNTLGRELKNIWAETNSSKPFSEILRHAATKGSLTLFFYLENNAGLLVVLVLLILGSFIYLRSLKSIYKENNLLANDLGGQLVLRYPLLSAMVLVITIGQFMFLSPPFIFNAILWIITCFSLTLIFNNFITRYWMKVWLSMVVLFSIAGLDNLILQASTMERWLMLLIAILGVAIGLQILFKGKKQELREKWIIVSIGFMVFLELGSMLANVFGRYNLAKTLLISGYLNVVVAILFLWTLRLINEGLFLAFSVYKRQDKKLFYLNFNKVGKKVPSGFYVLLVTGWFILFGRNFAGFEYIATPLRDFFVTERTLGNYTFSINSLLLFFLIMGVSVVVSKIVSFFASDGHLIHNREEQNSSRGIGSWLLLIRIGILSIGLFLAVAAAGIPLDRITIVIGALGVGIGFGLQNIVNNLVSGLVIAFEKPVNVGDIVDVDGQAGTMKSVGFRSSVITTWDGADVVMPNGDLLNSHLTNWSLGGNRRRIHIELGIAYDSNLQRVKELLVQILDQDERALQKPSPLVQYEQFGDNSINLKIFFWVRDFREAAMVKSDMIMAIADGFRKNGIKIPFPQHEVYLQSTPQTQKNEK